MMALTKQKPNKIMGGPIPTEKSRIVKLRIPPKFLSSLSSNTPSEEPVSAAPTIKGEGEASPSIQLPDTVEKSSESNATPVPGTDAGDGNSLAPPKVDGRRKRGGAAPSGRKRAPPSIDPNAPMRERGRPGPKKKPRLADGTIDRTDKDGAPAPSRPNAAAAHKLGPKANTGAINAGLRALDRTGKPCRKWERKGLQLKSFTGTIWGMSSWKAPPREQGFAGDVKSDSAGSSEPKPVNDSSDRSHSHADGDTTMMNGMESSPAPAIAV